MHLCATSWGELGRPCASPKQQGLQAGLPGKTNVSAQRRGCAQVRERSRAAGQEGVRAASRAEVLAALAADRAERGTVAPSQGSKAQARVSRALTIGCSCLACWLALSWCAVLRAAQAACVMWVYTAGGRTACSREPSD